MYNFGHEVPKWIKELLEKFLVSFILTGTLQSIEGLNRITVAALYTQHNMQECIRTNMLNGVSAVYQNHILKQGFISNFTIHQITPKRELN